MALEVTLPAALAQAGISAYNKRGLTQATPTPNSAVHHAQPLVEAAVKRAAQIASNSDPFLVNINPAYPGKEYNSGAMAGHKPTITDDGRQASFISINPNADAAYLAHELGHGVSQKTKAGKLVNDAKRLLKNNPKFGGALGMALTGALPVAGAALQEGDDDLAASLAIAAAAASPTLVDEALASKNALAIMNDAGLRASLGQRGRLAGGYLSYLAPVLIAGSLGNAAGNLVDDYTALYDL